MEQFQYGEPEAGTWILFVSSQDRIMVLDGFKMFPCFHFRAWFGETFLFPFQCTSLENTQIVRRVHVIWVLIAKDC